MKKEKPMLKGTQKRILQIKSPNSALFEEAYFVLKKENATVQGKDMVSEATRIIRQSAGQHTPEAPKKLPWQAWVGFAVGVLSGSGVTLAICLFL